jgi:hypothetical protein
MTPTNAQTTDVAWFCAQCGAADVSVSALAGGAAKCNVCSWQGKKEELAALPFAHDLGSPDAVFQQFFSDIRRLLSQQFAQDVGRMLIKWGFLEAPTPKNAKKTQQILARYIATIAKALAASIVTTRAELEKEQHAPPRD